MKRSKAWSKDKKAKDAEFKISQPNVWRLRNKSIAYKILRWFWVNPKKLSDLAGSVLIKMINKAAEKDYQERKEDNVSG